jgi:integrase
VQVTNFSQTLVTALRRRSDSFDSFSQNGAQPSDRVFAAVTPERVSLEFLRACRRAGVADFRLHDLRHTCASWLAMGGADIHLVAELLGHRDLRMAKRYRHLSPTYLQGAVRKLDTALGPELDNLPMLMSSHDGNTIEHHNEYKANETAPN